MLPSGPSPHLSSQEVDWHRFIQDSVVPMLGEGVVCAMRDQPNDPAAYLAEFLAAKGGSAEVAHTLSTRKLAGECARLDAELKWIRSQPKGNRGRDKGRIRKYDELVEAQQASRDADRVQSGAIAIAPGPRLGGFVVRAERLTRTVGETAR